MEKTKKMLAGVLAATSMIALSACGEEQQRSAKPTATDCKDWEWDEDTGTYVCDDNRSTRSGHYYYGGQYYSSKNALKQSEDYKTYRANYKSGIGSGSKGGFGG